MELKKLLDSLAELDEMECECGINTLKEDVDNALSSMAYDAKSAIEDVLDYLKEHGEGDLDDINTLKSALDVLANYANV